MQRAGALLAALLLAACGEQQGRAPAPLPASPQRIVSLNPCADALLRALADPAQIRAVSHYSQDARATLVPLDWARRFPATTGTAEEVLALRPDLVVASPHVALPTLAALDRLGVAVLKLPVPRSVAESRAQVEALAQALGHPRRGAALSDAIAAAVVRNRRSGAPVGALIWQGGGLVPGPGTLADELLAITGHANRAAQHRIGEWGMLGLERLVADPPAILYTGARDDSGGRLHAHPAIAGLRHRIAVERFPAALLSCAGPTIIAATDVLAATHDRHSGADTP
jgi:iron complex transport system substrate-binding protein